MCLILYARRTMEFDKELEHDALNPPLSPARLRRATASQTMALSIH